MPQSGSTKQTAKLNTYNTMKTTDKKEAYKAAKETTKAVKQAEREQAQKAVNEALKTGNKEQAAAIAAEYREADKAAEQERAEQAAKQIKEAQERAEAEAKERLRAEAKAEAEKKAEAVIYKGIAKQEAEARRSFAAKAVREGKSLNAICRNIIAAAKEAATKEEQAALLQFVGVEYPNAKADNITAVHLEQVKAATIITAAKTWTKYVSKEAAEVKAGQIAELRQTKAKGLYIAALLDTYSVSKVYLQPANNKAAKGGQQAVEIGSYYIKEAGKVVKISAVRAEALLKAAKEAEAKAAKEREAAAEQAERDREAGEAARIKAAKEAK